MSKAPKLRFKEFSGDWEEKKLGTLGQFLKGSTLSKADLSEEGKPCVLYGELYTKYNEVINNVISKTNLENDKLVLGQKNDVLIPSSGETAIDIATASCLQQDNVILGGDLNVFRSDKVNGVFTSYQLNSSKKREIARLSQGASVVHIYNDQLKKIKLSVPSKEEQEKIASFFSLIDYKISLQGEKVEALKDYKRGMMQKIFSRELRFKDDEGRDYPEWEEKKLGDIANLTSSKRVFASDYVDEGIPFYRGKEITELKQNKKPNDILYITQEKYDDIKNNFGIPVKGDLLLTAVGTLGNSYVIKDDNPFYFKDGNLIWFKDIKEDVNFLNFILTSEKGQKKIIDSAIGSTQKALTIVELNKLKYEFPSLKEQRKIAKFLNGLESKVMKEQEKLDFLNEYKKGLLQQMFV